MVRLDIYGGLLGTGKTTLIKRMLSTTYAGYKTAVIENEIGKVNLDVEELRDAAVSIKEISSGCICCTLKGSLTEAVKMLVEQEQPDYIVVEPSGAADLADVAKACMDLECVILNRIVMVVNAKRLQRLLKVVGNFFLDQLRNAWTVYLNFTDGLDSDHIEEIKKSLWEINSELTIVETPLPEIIPETFSEETGSLEKFRRTNVADAVSEKSPAQRSSAVKIHPVYKNSRNSWSYEFKDCFNEGSLERLMAVFRQEQCADIWRVKGCLKMSSGEIKKVDISFGDQFMESIVNFPENKTNLLVVIGKEINVRWLKKQFERL